MRARWPKLRADRNLARALLAAGLALAAAGCRQNMHNQAKVKTLAESDFFADGVGARPLPAHTIARGFLRDTPFYTGLGPDGKPLAAFPFPVTRTVLERGEQRFNIFCSPCHDRTGSGRGMIVRRGYKQPPSYHIDRLRNSPVGYFYNVISEGFGVMPSYASQIPPGDRWAIVAYVRALQLAENARLADLSPEERQRLDESFRKAAQGELPPGAGPGLGVQRPAGGSEGAPYPGREPERGRQPEGSRP
jgi:mono/diheme cytochrome c family protein